MTSAVGSFVKDLNTVAAQAGSLSLALPRSAAALQMFTAASGQGCGVAEDSQVIRAYRSLNRGSGSKDEGNPSP